MKPNFALSLSHDGIVLLQRSAAGWRSLGEANPVSPDLAAELEALRRTATALAPGGVRCKLVVPNNQIRYLTIETHGKAYSERLQAARDALEGATPYDVSDLVIDICEAGDITHVAAVARETLDEAETFAVEHRLHPVSFAAIPEPEHFPAEPFFGTTRTASDLLGNEENVERETTPFMFAADVTKDPAPTPTPVEPTEIDKPVEAEARADTLPPAPDETEPSFVSRRRVPTFRTAAPAATVKQVEVGAAEGTVPGFGDPSDDFDAEPSTPARVPSSPPAVVPAPSPVVRRHENEVERFTIYGARPSGNPTARRGTSGLLVLASVALLAGIGAFVSGMGGGLSETFARWTTPQPVAQFTAPSQPQVPVTTVAKTPSAEQPSVELAALQDDLTDEDAAVLDALRAPVTDVPDTPAEPTPEDLRAAYAVSGIWPVAPDVPSPPPLVDLEDLYVTSIDPINPNFDAVALPDLGAQAHDASLQAPASPAPAGTRFALDARGMVVATPDGAMNPDGVMVFAGLPPVRPPSSMVKSEDPGVDLGERLRLSGFRPQLRPSDLIENSERATFSGLTRSELAEIRPRLRPQSAQENALASASLVSLEGTETRALLEQPEGTSFDSATARAVVASLRPGARPKDFDKTVAKAIERAPAPVAASAAAPAPRVVRPKIPSSASATRAATVKNAINLRKVNLIGVYGKPSNRRALVRLGNGRYKKVEVGDRIDGGRVSAIGDSELRYQKSGRAIVLKMPRG